MHFTYIPHIPRLLLCIIASAGCETLFAEDSQSPSPAISWRSDYKGALAAAKEERKFALIWFYNTRDTSQFGQFERDVLSQPTIVRMVMEQFVAVRLPIDAQTRSGDTEVRLLDHPAFAEMQRSPGIALLDMTDETSPHFRQVVSVFPFSRRPITAAELAVML